MAVTPGASRPILDRVDDREPDDGDEEPRRRRRPSGEPPPLPRSLQRSGYGWGLALLLAGGIWAAMFTTDIADLHLTRLDQTVLDALARLRTPSQSQIARWVDLATGSTTVLALRWSTIVALLALRRVRHLLVFVGCVIGVELITSSIALLVTRPRPFMEILGPWEGFAHPSRPVAALAVTLVGMAYTLIPSGPWRNGAKWAVVSAAFVQSGARAYLGVDHPSDVIVAFILGFGVTVLAFRLLAPTSVFPVTYRGGNSAHVEIDDVRDRAIRTAVAEQLGLRVSSVEQHALEGSAGSTPLRLEVRGGEAPVVFAKLYDAGHLRADRSYKLVRTLLYGRLEDETPFSTVQRLVQYEDYMLRLMRDAGVPVPRPFGFVELQPEREYLLVTEFLPGRELGDVDASDEVIDEALGIVHTMWLGGLAHRDIKPSNIIVTEAGTVTLVDVAFAEARPSPWRQAVDLANMMLVLALRTDAARVYERAKLIFSDDEIAEGFAATRGVTVPTQLRNALRADPRDLVDQFRALAPQRPPISIQRWSVRRLAITLGAVGAVAIAAAAAWFGFTNAGLL